MKSVGGIKSVLKKWYHLVEIQSVLNMVSDSGILKCTKEMEPDRLSRPSRGFLHSGGGGGWILLLAWPPKFVSFRCFGQSQLVFGLKFKNITTLYSIN